MSSSRPLVLHVDDNETHRYLVKRILSKSDFEVMQGATGREGMDLLAEIRPDLIILDIKLPDANGMELCRQIKNDPETAHIPILQLSAHFTDTDHKVEGLESGADAYLASNVEPRELVATVKALLRIKAAEEQAHSAAEEWQSTFDAVRDAVLILNSECCLIRCNKATLAFVDEVRNEDLIHRPVEELFPGMDMKQFAQTTGAKGAQAPRISQQTSQIGQKDPQSFEHRGRWLRATVDRIGIGSSVSNLPRHVCVIADVTEEKQAAAEIRRINDDLIAARDSALEANRAKSAFLANMSHELRTPLNIIIGYTEMLYEDAREQDLESYVQDLERIWKTGHHLEELVSNILDLSKIEAGRVDVHLHSIEIASMVNEISETIKPLVEKRDNVLKIDLEQGLGSMWSDSVKLRQILLNLLSNACKFTEQGEISISARRYVHKLRDWVVFRVTDTGAGIDSEHLPSLFKEYLQLGEASGLKGTGLGLAISQRLSDMIGGTIVVESIRGHGSVFTLTVPAKVEKQDRPAWNVPDVPAQTRQD